MAYAGRRDGVRRERGTIGKTALLACLTIAVLAGCSDAPPESRDYAWLELGPGGERLARLITTAETCPPIEVDGEKLAMQVRALPSPPDFPVLTCEAVVSPDAQDASVTGLVLPLPRDTVGRIAVIGDTGCRVQDGMTPQACNDPNAWPFPGLASTVSELISWLTGRPQQRYLSDLASSVAETDPDLIIHVGDYLYRYSPCPEGDSGCAGSPSGFNWQTIATDFFAPAEPMFRKAPLALTRGNHESCNAAGEVWFRFFDPQPYDPTCVNYTEVYAIEVGGLTLLMLDSSNAMDTVMQSQVALYQQQFARLYQLAGPRSFLVTHRPLWGVANSAPKGQPEQLMVENVTLQASSGNELPPSVQAVLSGHVHVYQLLSFDPPRAPQMIVGNSGTSLAQIVTSPLAGLDVAGANVAVGDTLDEFGFVTLEASGADDWRLTLRDFGGSTLQECTVAGFRVSCP
jgi:hypothetical protein